MERSLRAYIEAKSPIHMVGIGGVSMSALAELLLSLGVPVSGSDRTHSAVTERLVRLGAEITYDHLPENVEQAALIVRTAAVHDDNPEIIRAHALGLPILERAEAWGNLMTDYESVICLSGTHGKTTTTSMMSLVAMEAQLDPTVMVGSHLPAIGGTLRIGAKGYFVAESCEYCNSFLSFSPTIAVILNIEADHLDFFKDLDDIIASFRAFCLRTPENGLIVTNADDPNALRAAEGLNRRVLTFGTTPKAHVYAANVTINNGYYTFDVMAGGKIYTKVTLAVPGKHNMMNALACCAVSYDLGLCGAAVSQGLSVFTGSSRRFQRTGTLPNGALVVDDYAHHPSEMCATLETARQMAFERIICVFQPHTYTRTKALFDAFVDALGLCDLPVIAPIYAAREQNTTGITARDLAQAVPGAVHFDSFEEIADFLRTESKAGDLILTMGAGNIDAVGRILVHGA